MITYIIILLSFLSLNAGSPSITFDLHRRRPSPHATTRLHHFRELAERDKLRQRAILERRRACAVTNWTSFAMPLNSGAYTGTGEYFVRTLLGTPAQKFVLVADTGSDLTWVKCRPGDEGGGGRRKGRVFTPELSKTFRSIGCSTELCKSVLPFSLAACPTPDSPCAYDYRYSDGSSAQGIYANESATITNYAGQRAKLTGLIIGCTSSSVGSSFRASDGVLGLGYSDISFASRATSLFGGRFAYCLVDHLSPRNVSSYITFGTPPALLHSVETMLCSTELLLDPRLQPFYGVVVERISIAGVALNISKDVWDVSKGGGTIVDSGTSLTILAEPAYKAVVSALSQHFNGLTRVNIEPFEYCYQWTEPREVPKLVVEFSGTMQLDPPSKSYVIDVADGVKCIGFTSTPSPGLSVIGNIMQQEHVWEFDLKDRRLRFFKSKCRPH